MFFIVVIVQLFKRHLSGYFTFWIYLRTMGIMSVICAVCKDVDECYH